MSSLRQPERYTLEEYFALERASERRFEYREGEIVCMSGGSIKSAAIARNIIRALSNTLSAPCQTFGSDLAVYVPKGRPYRYPDASVVCGEPRIQQVDGRDCLENPILLVEILSPTSTDYDLGTKFEEYKSIPSFTEYLIVAQDRPHVVRRTRHEGNIWHETPFDAIDSLDTEVHLDTIRIVLRLRDVYEGLRFK